MFRSDEPNPPVYQQINRNQLVMFYVRQPNCMMMFRRNS